MISAAAYRYARALTDVATTPGSDVKPEEAVAQLRAVEEVVAGSAELRTALMTPAIQPGNKRTVMRKLMDELSVSRVIRNLIFVVIDHRRVGLLTEIREAFEILMDERLGFVRADVVSAAPLEQEQSALLQSELSRLEGKQVRLRLSVDPALLGGAAARIGSTVYDGSIRGQLQEMRRKIAAHSADHQMGT